MFMAWESPEAVFQILKRLSAGMPCDITGIADYHLLDLARGIQWPHPDSECDPSPQRRLFADGRFYHPDGRARFLFEDPRPPPAARRRLPVSALDREGSAEKWHTLTRTAKSYVLRKLASKDPHVARNPSRRRDGPWAIARSVAVRRITPRPRVRACVFTPTVQRGNLFLPMHNGSTNRLTDAVFDPESRQPAYKACAARVRPSRSGTLGPDDDATTTIGSRNK